ncbi:MAG TPA: serine/threonine-protein kinase, partial [Pirellulales bacterium]|nr:serine/threonine-protein kinase [Pirellulales bacterium]
MSDAHTTDDADPGHRDERLIALAAAYDEALAGGEDSPQVALSADTQDEGSRAQFERARRVLEQLARVRRELTPLVHDSESGESISWYGPSWPLASNMGAVSDASILPRQLGRFEIVRELGRGGHGVVLLAYDPVLGRNVALKVPRPEALPTFDALRRFAREAQAAARLKHPYVVPVFEVCEYGPICFIASEHCDGPTLAAWLAARAKPVAPRQAATWLAALAQAVHYAHTQGVLHRDLKPGNVLLVRKTLAGETVPSEGESSEGRDLEPRVTDFGLAKLTETDGPNTRTGAVLGTPAYMAPEQAAGRLNDVGPATDVYALGVMLYEMLTTRPPLLGQSDLETLRRVDQEDPVPPCRLQSQVPRDLETFCLACLEKEPARRYATAGALADDLERFLNDRPISIRPPTVWRRGRLWVRRHPTQAVVLAAVLAVMTGLPTGLFWHSLQLQRERGLAVAAQVAAEQSAQIAREDEARIRQHVYVADMRLAQQLRQEGDLHSLAGLLDRYRPKTDDSSAYAVAKSPIVKAAAVTSGHPVIAKPQDVRGFEWRYLNRFRDIVRLRLQAHTGDINLLVFSGKGDVLATSSMNDGLVRLWEIPSGRPLGSFAVRATPSPRAQEDTAALSPNGDRVATLVDPQTIVVWDVHDNAELTRFTHKHTLHSVAFLSDATQVVGGGDEETLVWDLRSGQVVHTYPAARLVAVSPDGRQLGLVDALTAANHTFIWDLPTGVAERRFEWTGTVRQISYSPDATMLASLIDYPLRSQINAVNPHSGLGVQGYGERGERYTRIGFSGDSRCAVAVAGNGSLRFWDSQSGQLVGTLRGPARRLTNFAFSPDNRWLATAESGGSVLLWDGPLLSPCEELFA